MIYIITLNPAIDLVIITKKLESNTISRTEDFELQPNGKGVNISFILKKMDIKSMATEIGGGLTLDYITAGLEKEGIKTKFLKAKEPTRINVFTRALDQNAGCKEVNPGPEVGQEAQDKFLEYLKDTLEADNILAISGSFSGGIKAEYLAEVAKITAEGDIKLVIDSSSKVVLDTLQHRPYLLKPDGQELTSFSDLDEKLDQKKIIEPARKLISAGCQSVLVSFGEDGAALVNRDYVCFGNIPKIQTFNTAGVGDAVLGTFIGEKEKDKSDTAALKSTIVTGSDTANRSRLADSKLEKYLNEVQVDEIK